MANKSIEQLVAAQQVSPNDLFVLQQSGTAKKLTGQILENWLLSFAEGHGGIQSIVKTGTSGLVDTYRIIMSDQTTHDFNVTNGKAISSVTQYFAVSDSGTTVPISWSTSRQQLTATNKYLWSYTRYALNDGTNIDTPKAVIGVYGDTGLQTYVWIRWSNVADPSDSDLSQNPDDYIGIYTGTSETAPTTASSYIWYKYKGEQGDKGDNATVVSTAIRYQASTDSTIVPSGTWTSTIPSVPQGQFLWTQTTINFNTGAPIVFYSVARFGVDGTGSVVTVNGVSPDENGNVELPTRYANLNILSNWFFRRPINQRGHTSGDSPWIYTIDRWCISSSGRVVVKDDCVEFWGDVYQVTEHPELYGETVTISVLTAAGELVSGSGVIVQDGTWHYQIRTRLAYLAISESGKIEFHIYAESPTDIVAVKLELGDRQTLAHQENGVWVLNELPNFVNELQNCQAYYINFSIPLQVNNNQAVCHFPVTMRAIPNVSISINASIGTVTRNGVSFWGIDAADGEVLWIDVTANAEL